MNEVPRNFPRSIRCYVAPNLNISVIDAQSTEASKYDDVSSGSRRKDVRWKSLYNTILLKYSLPR